MQLGTLACGKQSFACVAADKKQMAMRNGYLLRLVVPPAFWAARKMHLEFLFRLVT